MFENLQVFQTASAMAGHAARSQALISQNVANADTPGFVGRQMPSFSALYSTDAAHSQLATRDGHLNGSATHAQMSPVEMNRSGDPNGNTVSLEAEMLKSAAAKSQHDRALAIYKSALDVLRVAISTK